MRKRRHGQAGEKRRYMMRLYVNSRLEQRGDVR